MKPPHNPDPEHQAQRDELAGDRIFAACFYGFWLALAVIDGLLSKFSRWIKRN